jgi:F-type H+-transporting ATPase subunit epsilon
MARVQVHVVSPEREIWSGEGDMVVARGMAGEVGILAGHAPMLVELAVAPVRVLEGDAERQKILVDAGFLHVTPGEGEEPTRVDVLAESAALPQEVSAAQARARMEELRATPETERDEVAQRELARAEMRAEHGTA